MPFEIITTLRSWFWNEHFWTPPGANFTLYEQAGYRHFNDLYYSLYTAVVLIVLRITLSHLIYAPIGIWLGLKQPKQRPPPPQFNAVLEKAFWEGRPQGKLTERQLVGLAKQLDRSHREIERWMRARAAQLPRKSVLSKFTETAWRFTFYLFAFIYGSIILWDKPWTWNSVHCFLDYPHHLVSSAEWWYYNMEAAFYLSLIVSQFVDVQRKDFWIMFTHHVVTLLLLTFSWACNLVRIGTLVIAIHDFADIPMEFGKLMAYVKFKRLGDAALVCFALFWIASRLVILPYRIIYYSSVVAPQMLPMFDAYYAFNGLLLALQALHLVWTYYIIIIAIHTISNEEIRDMRSDDEEEEDKLMESDDSDHLEGSKQLQNGHCTINKS